MIKILTDSLADLPVELVNQFHIEVIPALIHFENGTTYRTDKLSLRRFYQLLDTTAEPPRTESLPESAYYQTFARLTADGSTLIYVHTSSQLSQIFDIARKAARRLPDASIILHDSAGVTLWEGFQAMQAAQMAVRNIDAPTIIRHLEQMRMHSQFFFVLDTLTYLHKGGRVNLAKYMLGSALDLKPMLILTDGLLVPAAQERGFTRALAKMREHLLGSLQSTQDVWMGIVHTNTPKMAREVAGALKTAIRPGYTLSVEASSAIAAHAGPGGVGVITCPIPPL